jgi:hypothetical protein
MGKETNKSAITIQRRRHRVLGKNPRPKVPKLTDTGSEWAFQSDEDPEIEDSKLIGQYLKKAHSSLKFCHHFH